MITVTRERQLRRPISELWQLLANPHNLPRILPRIARVEVSEFANDSQPVTAYFDFGIPLGTQAAQGTFSLIEQQSIRFDAEQPLPIMAHWQLQPHANNTKVHASLSFDLKPILGPVAKVVPLSIVKSEVSRELEQALARIERLRLS